MPYPVSGSRFRRPHGVLAGARSGSGEKARGRRGHGRIVPGEDLPFGSAVARIDAVVIQGRAGAAAAQDQMDGSPGGVASVGGGDRDGSEGVDGGPGGVVPSHVMLDAANGKRSFVVVIMAAQHQVDFVAIEQVEPGLADAKIGTVARDGRTQCALVHLHHNPVHGFVGSRRGQRPLQPGRLLAGRIAVVIGRDDIPVVAVGSQMVDCGVVRPHRFAINAVRVDALHDGKRAAGAALPPHGYPGVRQRARRRPGHHHRMGRVGPPGEVDPLGGTSRGGRSGERPRRQADQWG
jgi:hypothetical protein